MVDGFGELEVVGWGEEGLDGGLEGGAGGRGEVEEAGGGRGGAGGVVSAGSWRLSWIRTGGSTNPISAAMARRSPLICSVSFGASPPASESRP